MSDCIFCKIVRGEIPCRKIYEDEHMLAFHDINPWAPVHFMIIPKQHIANLAEVNASHEPLLGRMFGKAAELARSVGLDDGFRTVVNTGRIANQEVYHLHIHILGGPQPLGGSLKPLNKQ